MLSIQVELVQKLSIIGNKLVQQIINQSHIQDEVFLIITILSVYFIGSVVATYSVELISSKALLTEVPIF